MSVLKKLVVSTSEKPTTIYTWIICFYAWVANVVIDLVLSPKRLLWFLFVDNHDPKNKYDSLLHGGGLVSLLGFFGFGIFGYVRVLEYADFTLLEWCMAAWCLPVLIGSLFLRAIDIVDWFHDGADEEDLTEHFLREDCG